jgi:cytochrome c biogenesis protein CcmG, thiol:disulfide interchange protein DsbE
MTRGILIAPLILLAAVSETLTSAPKKAAPVELELKDLTGNRVHLRDYRGKLVVLNFWATWCIPCRDEAPMFVEEERKWAARGVVFVGASLDDRRTQKNIPDFLRKFQIDFPVWVGAGADNLYKLGMGEAVPATAFLTEEGAIFARVQGEIKREELEERLDWATGDRSRPAPKPLLHNL